MALSQTMGNPHAYNVLSIKVTLYEALRNSLKVN